jgi:hypothetical protein
MLAAVIVTLLIVALVATEPDTSERRADDDVEKPGISRKPNQITQ